MVPMPGNAAADPTAAPLAITAARYRFSSFVMISAGDASGLARRNRATYASTAGACTRAPRSRMFDSAFAAGPVFSSASEGFGVFVPLRAAFIEPSSRIASFQATGRPAADRPTDSSCAGTSNVDAAAGRDIDERRWLPAWQHRPLWT